MTRIADTACVALLAAVMATVPAPAPAENAPVAHDGALVTHALISPAARRLALVETTDSERFVSVLALDSGARTSRMSLGREALVDLRWVDEERLVVTMSASLHSPGGSRAAGARYRALLYDTVRQRLAPLELESRRVAVANYLTALPALRPAGQRVRVYLQTQVVARHTRAALASVDPVSGASRVEQTAQAVLADWLVDADGKPAALLERAAADGRWTLRLAGADGMEERLSGDASDTLPMLVGFGPDEDSLLLRFWEGGQGTWRQLSREDGRVSIVPGVDQYGEPLMERLTGRVFGFCHPAERRCNFLEPARQRVWDSVVRAYEGALVEVVSFSDDFRQLVVLVERPAEEPVYQLVDFETGEARGFDRQSAPATESR